MGVSTSVNYPLGSSFEFKVWRPHQVSERTINREYKNNRSIISITQTVRINNHYKYLTRDIQSTTKSTGCPQSLKLGMLMDYSIPYYDRVKCLKFVTQVTRYTSNDVSITHCLDLTSESVGPTSPTR